MIVKVERYENLAASCIGIRHLLGQPGHRGHSAGGLPGQRHQSALLLVLLLTGIVKVDHVREKSDFLLGNLGFFFIPVSVSIINYVDLIWQNAAAFLTVCVVSWC